MATAPPGERWPAGAWRSRSREPEASRRSRASPKSWRVAQRGVELVRCADVHHVDVRRRYERLPVGVRPFRTEAGGSLLRAGRRGCGDADDPGTCRRAACAWTAPMNPAPTTPTLSGDRPLGPDAIPPRGRYCRTLMSAVNQNLSFRSCGTAALTLFDRPKSRWFTVGVIVGSDPASSPGGSNGPGSTSPTFGGSAGAILQLVRSGQASTRGELAAMTGLARSTIAQRVDALLTHRFLVPGGDSASTGGRRPTVLAFNRDAGVVLAGDLGATHSRVAVTDLAGEVLAQDVHDIAVAEGPSRPRLAGADVRPPAPRERARAEDVRGVGVGLPGPVEFATGRPVSPPIMPGWNLYPVGDRLGDRFSAPALVDNDVNIMGLGEYWSNWRDEGFLLFVKVGTGIGSASSPMAVSTEGRTVLQVTSAISTCPITTTSSVVAEPRLPRSHRRRCGARHASSRSRVGRHTGRDVVAQVLHGQHDAVRLIRQAGHTIGGVLATCVNMLNPAVIVIGGDLAGAGEPLFAGIREIVYRRSLPLATGNLRIVLANSAMKRGSRARRSW